MGPLASRSIQKVNIPIGTAHNIKSGSVRFEGALLDPAYGVPDGTGIVGNGVRSGLLD